MNKKVFVILFLLGICSSVTSRAISSNRKSSNRRKIHTSSPEDRKTDKRVNTVEPPLLVGSFNIQTLGPKKFRNPDVIYTVEKVIQRYDLILVMELLARDDSFLQTLLRDVNLFAPEGVVYNMTVSSKHPNTSEHSAIFYRTNKMKVLKTESYENDVLDKFYRKPFIVIFQSFTLRDMNKFGVIGHHVKPSKAVQEIDALADVYDYVTSKYKTDDVLLMGDFNADCSYVKEKDWEHISLWTRPEFTWAITKGMDTTTNYGSCTHDRIVYAGENMNNGVILSSARVFNFQQEYELSIQETRNISDHWPIELKIRSRMSDLAEKHLTTDICFKIRDSRNRGNISESYILALAKTVHFNGTSFSGAILLSNTTRTQENLLMSMERLQKKLPGLVTHELAEAVKYKLNHGSLEDESSYADVWDPQYKIDVLSSNDFSEVVACRTTTVN